jgi:type II secretory pathway pseudopilin PulG
MQPPPTQSIVRRPGIQPMAISIWLGRRRAFTLVELLVVVVIIITIAALTLAVIVKMRARADNVLAVSYMRQVGTAISSYLSENQRLPTFNSPGVDPKISTGDLFTQACALQPYIGMPEPTGTIQYAEIFRPPGLKTDNMSGKSKWYEVTSFITYSTDHIHGAKAYLPKGVVTDDTGQDIGPFGKVNAGVGGNGWTQGQIDAGLTKFGTDNGGTIATLSMVPAMLEINKEYPSIGGYSGMTVPERPLRDNKVNVLYFDWRVESVAPDFFYKP